MRGLIAEEKRDRDSENERIKIHGERQTERVQRATARKTDKEKQTQRGSHSETHTENHTPRDGQRKTHTESQT